MAQGGPTPLPTASGRNPSPFRPPRSAALQTALFALYFNACILVTHATQYLFVPLAVLPATRPYFHAGIRYTKHAFGRLIVAITQFFAPTKLVLTCEGARAAAVVRTDKKGRFAGLDLPRRGVWMSNHQVRERGLSVEFGVCSHVSCSHTCARCRQFLARIVAEPCTYRCTPTGCISG